MPKKRIMKEIMEQKIVEDSLRQECEATIGERARRYLQVKPHSVIPATHFAAVSAEVTLLFRDGHYYGCIALAQEVAEALVRFMCERNSFKPVKEFEKNVGKLYTRNFINNELKSAFLRIWEKRDDYHHLNSTIEKDRQKLEGLALEKARLLNEIESKVFNFTIFDGCLNPTNPRYWDINGDYTQGFLRLHP
jgi:hypothetical protein